MRIVCYPHNYLPFFNGGAETYMHRLLKGLQNLGHEIKVIANYPEAYVYDGIEVIPQGMIENMWEENNDIVKSADVVFTQLMGCAVGYNKAKQFKKPLLFFAHNTASNYPISHSTDAYVVYNSKFVKNALNWPHKHTVLTPLVDYRDFTPSPIEKRKYITLINCNENKGADQFIELAKMLPQYQFLGINGAFCYPQITADLPNLTYVDNTPDIAQWYEQTKILLMPSKIETYGQTATEAICMGIPVICTPTAGLKENLENAGIYIDRNDLTLYAETIVSLMENKDGRYDEQTKVCLQRAIELDPEPRLQEFNKMLLKVK